MLRSILSVVALAGVLVAAQPVFADHLAATASDHAQAAAAMMEQPAPQPNPAGAMHSIAPAGFGWG
jgi:hypothetical protein